jgi:hypothetical protein
MNLVSIVFLIVLGVYAVKDAEEKDWKLINVGIIVGSMLVGFVFAFVLGYIAGNPNFGSIEGLSLAIAAGYAGGAGAVAWNYWRNGGIRKRRKRRSDKSDETMV